MFAKVTELELIVGAKEAHICVCVCVIFFGKRAISYTKDMFTIVHLPKLQHAAHKRMNLNLCFVEIRNEQENEKKKNNI